MPPFDHHLPDLPDLPSPPADPFGIVLYQPEIPPNTGNIMRLCAATGSVLHLVGTLGFRIDAAGVRRAGMDYRELSVVERHDDWERYLVSRPAGQRRFAFSTRGTQCYGEILFRPGDHLLFGSEGGGLPERLLHDHRNRLVRIPMASRARSLNLANTVAIVLYEALRQNGFPGLV